MKVKNNLLFTFLIVLAISFVGCDSNDDESELSGFLGDWQQVEDDEEADVFIRVTESRITVAAVATALPNFAVCTILNVDNFDVENGRIAGTDSDGEAYVSSISLSGDQLIVDGETYGRTTNFPTCATTI